MSENPGDTGCSFVQLSVHNDTPAIDIGSIWIAAYPIPWIVAVILCVANAYRKRSLQSTHESKDAAKAERALSPAPQSLQPWTAPNVGLELLRIAGFLFPMALSIFLVGFCFSSLKWRWVLAGLPATPPFNDSGFFGAMVFLLAWIAASDSRDKMRAQRPPMETFRTESWICAKVAERALVLLLAAWMAAWVLSQLVDIYLACFAIRLLSGYGCKNSD